MGRNYHILNGDSLKEQFPPEIGGEVIIVRECLVDGDVKGHHLDEFFRVRAQFISTSYDDYSVQDYFKEAVSEFEKIRTIPPQSFINLWFEDDLFCQVNFWFVVHLLHTNVQKSKIFLVRPKTHTRFGFGGLNQTELVQVFTERIQLDAMDQIALLWEHYKSGDVDQLFSMAQELKNRFPFILPAVEAHIARIPTKNSPGRPIQSLMKIMEELDTDEFEPVFREFHKREDIYGFGDVQVKKLFDEIRNNR